LLGIIEDEIYKANIASKGRICKMDVRRIKLKILRRMCMAEPLRMADGNMPSSSLPSRRADPALSLLWEGQS
jgi:hypothetical protein